MKFEISVIIPVFNSEKFLKKNFESILSQTFSDFEIIVIDDGSTDSSVSIIKEYLFKFKNCFFFKIPHSGISFARSLGLILASGKFIAFVDSDDIIKHDFLENLYEKTRYKDIDIVMCDYEVSTSDKNTIFYHTFLNFLHFKKIKSGVHNSKDMIGKIILDITIRSYFWNKLFKKSLFFNNNLIIPNICYEDRAIILRLFYFSNKIFIDKKKLYVYNIHKGSTTANNMNYEISLKQMSDYIASFSEIKLFLKTKECNIDYKLECLIIRLNMSFALFLFFLKHIFAKDSFFKKINVFKLNFKTIWS